MANCCVECCETVYQIPTRVLCFLLVIAQGGILDYFLVTHKSVYWYGWIAADVALGLVFIMTFLISYRHLSLVHQNTDTNIQAGSLPLGYFAWFVYSVFLGARVFIIYRDFAWQLNLEDVFGPNTLKITISVSAFVFLLLLLTHNDAVPGTRRKYYIEELTATVVFDILDSVDALDIFFNKADIDDLPQGMELAILVISCVNLLLPVLPLITLSHTHFGHKTPAHWVSISHKLCLVFLVNLPLFMMRMLLWHMIGKEISIFPVKNIFMIFVVFHDLYDKKRSMSVGKNMQYHSNELGCMTDQDEDKAMCGHK